jgi:putative transposase
VEDARSGGADRLSPPGKKLSDQLTSEATPSFNDARQRLPLELFYKTLQHTATQVSRAVQIARYCGLQAALLDGSTLRLRYHRDIPTEFPPHRTGNCKKEPYWCLARVVAMFCLATGTVLNTVLGSLQQSEQGLSFQFLRTAWKDWLIIADRNFGVYSVVRAARATQAQLLLRLIQARAAKLARPARIQLAAGLDTALSWTPSAHDQCPPDLLPEPIPGRLLALCIARPGFRTFTLYLFTTLSAQLCPAQTLAQLYGQRWRVELYLRYVKPKRG